MYQRGKIYKITSNQTDNIYIGSTCNPLSKRIGHHKDDFKSFLNAKQHYMTSYELIKLGDAIITLIENYPCESIEQLRAKERFHIEANKNICVNKNIPNRTQKEYQQDNKEAIEKHKKEYYQDNKEVIAEKAKKHYQSNKEVIAEKSKEYRQDNKEVIAEKQKEYYQDNKEVIAEKQKEYREDNKDAIAEKQKQKINCICGVIINYSSKSKHERTIKHLAFINSQY